MGRKILSVLAGLFVGMMIIMIFRVVAVAYYPFPDGLEWANVDDMNTYFSGLPDGAYVLIIASHAVGALLGSLITALISTRGRFSSGIITGAIIFTFVIAMNFTYDFPGLYIMSDTLLAAVGAFTGASFGQGRKV